MTIFSFLTMIGGLAFFLFGMNIMSSNLEKVAGGKLEVILQHFIEAKFVRPKDRPYQTDNYYAALQRMAEAEQEVNAIVLHAEAKKRKGSRKAARQPQQK